MTPLPWTCGVCHFVGVCLYSPMYFPTIFEWRCCRDQKKVTVKLWIIWGRLCLATLWNVKTLWWHLFYQRVQCSPNVSMSLDGLIQSNSLSKRLATAKPQLPALLGMIHWLLYHQHMWDPSPWSPLLLVLRWFKYLQPWGTAPNSWWIAETSQASQAKPRVTPSAGLPSAATRSHAQPAMRRVMKLSLGSGWFNPGWWPFCTVTIHQLDCGSCTGIKQDW